MPTVSLQTLTGTFNGERTELRDTILTPEVVESLGEQAGASVLVFSLQTEGEIPDGGVEVTVNSDIALTDYFRNLGRSPFSVGSEVTEAVYDENGTASGFRVRIDSPNALVSLTLENKEEVETDGPETATFSLETGEGFSVGNGSSTVTFYDSLDTAPVPDMVPQISLTVDETELIESEGNTTTLTFNVDGDIPDGGVVVYVNSPDTRGALGEFDVFNTEISGGTVPFGNFAASGFYFKILEDGASITLPAFDETTNPEIEEGIVEGIQSFSFELVESPGYTIDNDASGFDLTIADNPDSQIQVSYSVEPAALIESVATVGAHIFELSSPPPAEGVTVSVSAPNLTEFDLDSIEIEGGEIVGVSDDLDGFEFKITSQSATINLPVADDGEDEGLEEAVFTVEPGEGYQVNPDANMGTFSLVDTPDQVPAPTEVGEPNDTIGLAVPISLTSANPEVSFTSTIDYENSNRYDLEDGNRLYVDFTEDVDFYKIDLEAGDIVRLDTDAQQLDPETVDTVVRVFDANGNQVDQVDDAAAPDEAFADIGFDSYLEFTPETSGTYYFGISSWPNAPFDYFEAGVENRPYDPNIPASGTGSSFGEYTVNLTLNQPIVPEATEIPSSTGDGPTVSLRATPATFRVDEQEQDTLEANALVQYLEPDTGASVLSLALEVEGAIPEEGIEVYLTSDTDLGSIFSTQSPFSQGGAEILGGVYDETGTLVGLQTKLTSNSSLINLTLDSPETAPTDGSETITFNLEPSADYSVGTENSFSTVIYDTLADVPELPNVPTVSLDISETALVESEGNLTTLTFSLDSPPPEEGTVIGVDSGIQGALGEFGVFDAEVIGGEFPAPNFQASGFFFRVTEQTATITLAAFDETNNPQISPEDALEGIEEFTFTLQQGVGYAIAPDANAITLTIADNPDSVVIDPGDDGDDEDEENENPEQELNDTITTAIDTGLSSSNPTFSFQAAINTSDELLVSEDPDVFQAEIIDASEDVDMYSFELVAGETVAVDVDSIEYFLEDDPELADVAQRFDSELRLFDAEGNELLLETGAPAPDEVFNANRDAYLEYTAEETGTYYVGVAQLGNRTYDPFEAGTGSGRIFPSFGINIGEYTIDINLTTDEAPNQPSDRNDLLNGDSGDDLIAGLSGDDTIFGADGEDTLRGDLNSRDPGGIVGGDDVISGGNGNDEIGGKGGNDLLSGDAGDDLIWGDDGNDTIMGVTGNDTLTGDDFSGGSGNDLFVFGNGDGTDTITDFDPTQDMIALVEGELMFEDIEIITIDGDAAISVMSTGETLAILDGVSPDELTEELFMVTPDVSLV
ncbi:MAG: pre-peptidase C-terminal domain-containing protein [Microcoleaceae cyanobacterium]